MFIALFYLFTSGIFVLLGWLFGIFSPDFQSVWTYLLIFADLILSVALSFLLVLITLWFVGLFRRKKPYTDKFNHYFANSFLRLVLHLLRIKVVVSGKENLPDHNKFVFVCNHQENYDIPVLMPALGDYPICFIAKEPLFRVPFIGKWIALLGNVPIGRMADREAAKSIITGIKRYKQGVPFGIFPEGRRARSNEMIEFKAGAFKLAMKPKADILIGTIYDMGKVFKRFPWKRYVVRVHFHPMLPYSEYKDMISQDLSAHVKAVIQSKLDDWNQKSPQV